MVRRWPRSLQFEEKVVRIAIEPILSGFEGSDQWMVCAPKVLGGVPVGGVVAASDVTARLAHPKVDPLGTTHLQALLAAGPAGGDLADLVEV
jgi:hypothetical protein